MGNFKFSNQIFLKKDDCRWQNAHECLISITKQPHPPYLFVRGEFIGLNVIAEKIDSLSKTLCGKILYTTLWMLFFKYFPIF